MLKKRKELVLPRLYLLKENALCLGSIEVILLELVDIPMNKPPFINTSS